MSTTVSSGQQKKKKNRIHGLRKSMLVMTMAPIILTAVIVAVFCSRFFSENIDSEAEKNLRNIVSLTREFYDRAYPGDYVLAGNEQKVFAKGNQILSEHYDLCDSIRDNTGTDISLYYLDTCVLTTIKDDNGRRIIGSGCPELVEKEVLDEGCSRLYKNVDVYNNRYYAYFEPLINSDGKTVGMIFAGRPHNQIVRSRMSFFIPFILILLAEAVVVSAIVFSGAGRVMFLISQIEADIVRMTNGDLSRTIGHHITSRGDEIGNIARRINTMQHSLRELIERDPLTRLFNRRSGISRFESVITKASDTGLPFCVALGDIDKFKSVNDTYGHDAGDEVLRMTARILQKGMTGQGFAVRWGGEEFLLIFSGTGLKEAHEHLQNTLKQLKESTAHTEAGDIRVSMTFGMIEGETGLSLDNMINRADALMYHGKNTGRDRIVTEDILSKEQENEEPVTNDEDTGAEQGNSEDAAGETTGTELENRPAKKQKPAGRRKAAREKTRPEDRTEAQ